MILKHISLIMIVTCPENCKVKVVNPAHARIALRPIANFFHLSFLFLGYL